MNIIKEFNLSVEEQAEFNVFKRKVDEYALRSAPEISETEIRNLVVTYDQFVQGILQSVTDQRDKSDA